MEGIVDTDSVIAVFVISKWLETEIETNTMAQRLSFISLGRAQTQWEKENRKLEGEV